jgi:hypothetical protein
MLLLRLVRYAPACAHPVNVGTTAADEQRRATATSVRGRVPLRNVIRVVTVCATGPRGRNATSVVTERRPGATVTVRAGRPLTEKRTWRISDAATVTRAWVTAQVCCTDSRGAGRETTRSPATAIVGAGVAAAGVAATGAGAGATGTTGVVLGAGAAGQLTTLSASAGDVAGLV